MAGYYNTSKQELDDAHRLLPQEILEDIGIMAPAEQQFLDVIEDLAARLTIVLGGTPNIKHPASRSHPPVNASCTGELGERAILAGRGNNVRRVVAAPPFSPAPAVPCHAMAEGLRNNNMVFFAPAKPLGAGAQPATVHRRAGTGVFLTRNEGACRTARAALPPGNSKNFGFSHRRGQQQPAMVVVKVQQEMQPMASRMVQNYLGVHASPVFSQSRRN